MATYLVLSGGAAKGAYQTGFIWAAHKRGIRFDGAAGISAGAINAASVSCELIEPAVDVWRRVTERDVMRRGSALRFGLRTLAGLLPGIRGPLGYHDTRPLRGLLEEFFEGAEVKKPLYVGRVDLVSGLYVDEVTGGNVAEAVYRSTLIPGAMSPEVAGESIWVDGGINNITPTGRVCDIAAPGDEIFIVTTQERRAIPRGINKPVSDIGQIDLIQGITDYLLDLQFERDLRLFELKNRRTFAAGGVVNDDKVFRARIVHPSSSLGAGDDYSREALDYRFQLGVRDGNKLFDLLEVQGDRAPNTVRVSNW